MKIIMTCAAKNAQQPGVAGSPIMVAFNGPRGSVAYVACDDEDQAGQFKMHSQYELEVRPVE